VASIYLQPSIIGGLFCVELSLCLMICQMLYELPCAISNAKRTVLGLMYCPLLFEVPQGLMNCLGLQPEDKKLKNVFGL
jgi:hypothetical protein